MNNNSDDVIRLVIALALALLTGGFLAPTAIALARNRQNMTTVILWNTVGMLLFGLGWVIALVFALQPDRKPASA